MKRIVVLSLLVGLSLSLFSQADSSTYYSASRLDYYSYETVGEVLVFVPSSLKEYKVTVDLVFEYEFLNRGAVVIPGAVTTVKYPMELLREGQNEITVSFYENDKWVDSRKIWITKRPYHENEVKVDLATGGLVVSGLPYFPFGFYTSFPVDTRLIDVEASKGFSQVSPYQEMNKKTLKGRKTYMDRFANVGIRVNYNLTRLLSSEGSDNLNPGWKERLQKEIELFRDAPALLTWYIAENPDATEVPPDSLLEVYRLIKELDPYHPVSLLLSSPRNAVKYKDVMDVVMIAPSPVPQGVMLEMKDYTRIPSSDFWLQKPVWVVAQTVGGNVWWQREPNPKEARVMTYMALIYGARGIQLTKYGINDSPKSTAMWNEYAAIALEFAELTPDFLSTHPAPAIITENPGIHARVWNRAGLVTVVVVNEKNEPGFFSLKMKDVDLTISAELIFENRKIDITDGRIDDMIDGYGTRVYRFDARRMPDRVKGLERGNLSVDGGFEDISNVGVPASCFAESGDDPGSTFFIDSRRKFEGEHSLRMNNPSDEPGDRLSFYGLDLDDKKSYTLSIMAMTGASSNSPGGKKGGPVVFRLGLGSTEGLFNCTEEWHIYKINGVRITGQDRVSPVLELAGKGTAWFDLLQVYPDMELVELRGEEGIGSEIIVRAKQEDAQIYYTLDGSDPTSASLPYMIPVIVDNKMEFKAAAYKGGVRVGYIER